MLSLVLAYATGKPLVWIEPDAPSYHSEIVVLLWAPGCALHSTGASAREARLSGWKAPLSGLLQSSSAPRADRLIALPSVVVVCVQCAESNVTSACTSLAPVSRADYVVHVDVLDQDSSDSWDCPDAH